MAITGAPYCRFIGYTDELPKGQLDMITHIVYPDKELIEKMKKRINLARIQIEVFVAELIEDTKSHAKLGYPQTIQELD